MINQLQYLIDIEYKIYCNTALKSDFDAVFNSTQDVNVLILKAYYLIGQGKVSESEEILNKLIESDSQLANNSYYLACLISLESNFGYDYNSISILTQIADDDKMFENKWLSYELILLLKRYKNEKYKNLLQDLVEDHTTFIPGLILKSQELDVSSQAKDIIYLFRNFLESEQNCYNIEMCNILASAYIENGQGEFAIEWINRSLQTKDNSDAFMLRGMYNYYVPEDNEKAFLDFSKAIELDKANLEAFMLLYGLLFQEFNHEKLVSLLEEYELNDLNDKFVGIVNLGYYLKLGLFDKASSWFKENSTFYVPEVSKKLSLVINLYKSDNLNNSALYNSAYEEIELILNVLADY